MRILDFGFWMLDVGVAGGDDFKFECAVRSVQRAAGFGFAFSDILKKKALQSNAIRNHSPFIIHHSPFHDPRRAL